MLDLLSGWALDVQRGPDGLFVRLSAVPDQEWPGAPLADTIWSLMQQHFAHRLVIECDQVEQVTAELATQLAILQQKIAETGGILRLTGLTRRESGRSSIASPRRRAFRATPIAKRPIMAGRPRQAR